MKRKFIEIVLVSFITFFIELVESAPRIAVARALPEDNVSLTGTPMSVISGISRIQCLVQCVHQGCSSFNYGQNACELLPGYLCGDTESLYPRSLFKHYDVETEDFVPLADDYRQESDCITLNRCSPKCYPLTTTTPTTTPPVTTPTTPELPEPGEIGHSCSTDSECTIDNSNCRSDSMCECVAGYSYNHPTKACVTACPGGYGDTFTLTSSFYIFEYNLVTYDNGDDVVWCQDQCIATPGCVSIEYDTFLLTCSLSAVTKYGHEGAWTEHVFFNYYQRNCV